MERNSICLDFTEHWMSSVLYCRRKNSKFLWKMDDTIFKILVSSGFWMLLIKLFLPPTQNLFASVTNAYFIMKLISPRIRGKAFISLLFCMCSPLLPPIFLSAFSSLLMLHFYWPFRKASVTLQSVVGWRRWIGKWVRGTDRGKLG